MTKEELEKEARTECFMLTVNTIGIDQRDVELAYVMGAEPREKRIEELIALINAERERQEKCDDVHLRTIADLEKENAELKQADEGKVVEHFEAYGQCRDSRRIAELEEKLKHAEENCINKTCVVFKDKEDCVAKLLELEKENAELKEKLNFSTQYYQGEKAKEQLTKAKQIIKNLLSAYTTYAGSFDDRDNQIVSEAEQFLKDSEVEK